MEKLNRWGLQVKMGHDEKHALQQYVTVIKNHTGVGDCFYVFIEGGYIYGFDRTYSSGNPIATPTGHIMFQAVFGENDVITSKLQNRIIYERPKINQFIY